MRECMEMQRGRGGTVSEVCVYAWSVRACVCVCVCVHFKEFTEYYRNDQL